MSAMSSQISYADILNASAHLPAGAMLVIHEFDWDDYEHLVEAFGDHSHRRVSYDCGRLEVLSPSSLHDKYAWYINYLICAFCEIRNLSLVGFGHTTWKKKSAGAGLEADGCYYINSAKRIREERNLSLEHDPPPDIALEIDLTRSSLRKFPIYAALKFPEIWRYDGKSFRFYRLTDGEYHEIQESSFLPGLPGPILAEGMEACKAGEPMDALKAFRKRVQRLKRRQSVR